MNAVCAALALLFTFVVLAQPVETRVDYTPTAWGAR